MSRPGRWRVRELHAHPSALHQPVDPLEAEIRLCRPSGAALVLGSTQPAAHVDGPGAASQGLDVVRRRSGGAAVLVVPGDLVWIDVAVPRGDPLWQEDVGRAFLWLGEVWAQALRAAGAPGAAVHEGPLLRGRWGSWACFASLGPGEVSLGTRKVVGMSQRRVRAGAVFHTAAIVHHDADRLARALALASCQREALASSLRDGTAELGELTDAAAIEQAVVDAISRR